jgi:hypothetical protein
MWLIKWVLVLDDWIYWHLIHTTRDYRQYSAIADLHTLQFIVTHAVGFSVFTSHILTMGSSQSHCHFKSYMKSSLHILIPSFSFLLSHLGRPFPELDPVLDNNKLLPWSFSLHNLGADPTETPCLLIRCLAIDALLLHKLAAAGMCSPSRCLTLGLSRHNKMCE